MGHKVIGVDVSRAKVEMMDSGRTPIIEARMTETRGRSAPRRPAARDTSASERPA
jgi:UDP-glucose 6-dehydrogenase